MFKRPISYEDFNGEKVTDIYYFNLTKSEIVELDSEYAGGVGSIFGKIVEAKDKESMIKEFKKFILASYGEKSDDGKRFIKSDELRLQFTQTAAYDALFIELATSDEKATEFILGVLPKEFTNELASEIAIQVPPLAPPAPPVSTQA